MDFMKSAQRLKSAVMNVTRSTDETEILLPEACYLSNHDALQSLVLNILFQHPHLVKSLRKVLKTTVYDFRAVSQKEFEKKLGDCLGDSFSTNLKGHGFPFYSISFLLEDCPFSHTLLSQHLEKLIENVNVIIKESTQSDEQNTENTNLCDVVKTVLQVIQFMKKDVTRFFSQASNEAILNKLLEIANNCIIIMQENKKYSSPLRNMCSVFIGHILNYDNNDYNLAVTLYVLCGSVYQQDIKPSHPFSSITLPIKQNVSDASRNLYRIFLLKGVFSCTRPSSFAKEVNLIGHKTFIDYSFKMICKGIKDIGESQYDAFQVLKLWWSKAEYFSKSEFKSLGDIHNDDGIFVQDTLKILFKYWDNPISGVPAIIVDIFKVLIRKHLSLHHKAIGNSVQGSSGFLENILDDLIKLSPAIKGKYNFITALIPEVSVESLLERYPNFLLELVPLLGINHLCPVISKTYSIVISTSLKEVDKSKRMDVWTDLLLPSLSSALLDSNPVVRLNASIRWLPVHIKLVPGAYHRLVDVINTNFECHSVKNKTETKLLALIAVTKVARSEKAINLSEVEGKLLHLSLSCFNDDARSEAFRLVCCHNRTSEWISLLEMELIKTYLPMNMNIDSPTFRQQLVFCIRSFCERMKDSVINAEKMKNSQRKNDAQNYVTLCEEVFAFILNLCVNSLHIAFTFQRKKTAVDIFSVLLTTFHPFYETIPFTKVLTSSENRIILFELLYDQIPEIRKQSLQLLIKYFPHPGKDIWQNHIERSSYLCKSPRSQDNESGAIIWEYLLGSSLKLNAEEDRTNSAINMINDISSKFKEDVNKLKHDIMSASHENPAHGWMLALSRCFSSPHWVEIFYKGDHDFPNLIQSLVLSTVDLTQFVLSSVFSSDNNNISIDENGTGLSADFSEMTKKIESLVLENNDKVEITDVMLTEHHEAVLACSWLCLLRGSSLLSSLSTMLVKMTNSDILLTRICQTFIKILTSCRHRGAIEGCFESFSITCESIMTCPYQKYRGIIENILINIIQNLNSNSETGSNVTRRSAGIPLIIEAILVSEISCKKDELFHKTIKSFIDLSKQVCSLQPRSTDEIYDVPQVHGLYVLKYLFRNSKLSSHILPYCFEVFKIAVNCISSPIWVVRNAATHLFGAVSTRMLGQKNIDGTHIENLENSISTLEFFSHFRNLYEFIVGELQLFSTMTSTKLHLPKLGVHPILCVLSKLTYGKHDINSENLQLSEAVSQMLGSPICSIRHLAAKSLLGLESRATLTEQIIKFLKTLPLDLKEQVHASFNQIHGYMILSYLVVKKNNSDDDSSQIYSEIIKRPWLWGICISPLIATTGLEIIVCFLTRLKEDEKFIVVANRQISHCLHLRCENIAGKPGLDLYLEVMVPLLLNVSDDKNVNALFKGYLFSNNVTIRKCSLKWLIENPSKQGREISETIITFILKASRNVTSTDPEVLDYVLKVFIDLNISHTDYRLCSELYYVVHHILSSNATCLSLKCSSLKMLSTLLVQILKFGRSISVDENNSIDQVMVTWSNFVNDHASHTKASEPLRLSAAESLKIAGRDVFEYYFSQKDTKIKQDSDKQSLELTSSIAHLTCSIISLLHDEQPDIRGPVCYFVSTLCSNNDEEIYVAHQNVALKKFLNLLMGKLTIQAEIINILMNNCISIENINVSNRDRMLLFDKEPFNLYEEPLEIAQVAANNILNSTKLWTEHNTVEQLISLSWRSVDLEYFDVGSNFIKKMCNILYIKTILKMEIMHKVTDTSDKRKILKSSLRKVLQNSKNIHKRLLKEMNAVLALLEE